MNENLWNSIYGNTAVKSTFMSDIATGRLSHAFIIEGVEGSGKLTLARTIIASMQDNEVHIGQIMNGVCSDVFEIDVPEEKKKISVDAIRFIRTSSVIKAGDLDIKAYIIKSSEQMTRSLFFSFDNECFCSVAYRQIKSTCCKNRDFFCRGSEKVFDFEKSSCGTVEQTES